MSGKGQWRISVNGEWFYGTLDECKRERAEYESTFTAEDFAEMGEKVLPELIYSAGEFSPLPVKTYSFKGAAGLYVYEGDYKKALIEIERLKKIVNFDDAVACVFDNLKFCAANTRDKEWDDQLEELADDVIEFSPSYKKQWKDIGSLSGQVLAKEREIDELKSLLLISMGRGGEDLPEEFISKAKIRINQILDEM